MAMVNAAVVSKLQVVVLFNTILYVLFVGTDTSVLECVIEVEVVFGITFHAPPLSLNNHLATDVPPGSEPFTNIPILLPEQ